MSKMERNKTLTWDQVTGYRVSILDWMVRKVILRWHLSCDLNDKLCERSRAKSLPSKEQLVQKSQGGSELGKFTERKISMAGASWTRKWEIPNEVKEQAIWELLMSFDFRCDEKSLGWYYPGVIDIRMQWTDRISSRTGNKVENWRLVGNP